VLYLSWQEAAEREVVVELDAGAITIHVYSPPIRAIGHYDLDDGQLRRTQGLPDDPSPPSTALYQALHPSVGTD